MAARKKLGSNILVRYVLINNKKPRKPLNVEFLAQAWCLRDRIRVALDKIESPRIVGLRFDSIRMADSRLLSPWAGSA